MIKKGKVTIIQRINSNVDIFDALNWILFAILLKYGRKILFGINPYLEMFE